MSRLFALMSVAAALSAPALAAEKPRVLLVPLTAGDGATESATARFSGLLGDALKARGESLTWVEAPAARRPEAARAAVASNRGPSPEAVAALAAGRKASDDLRFDDAVTNLKKGIGLMLAEPATADYEAVTDAWVKLAAAEFRKGAELDARGTLLELARFAPDYKMPQSYPPIFLREFARAQKRLDKAPRGQVSIEGPAGATAFLDGRDLGMVPVLEERVPAGTHYVKVEGGKGERFGQTVEVKGGLVKVRAAFSGGGGERTVVSGPVDPQLTSHLDAAAAQRLAAYLKTTGADFAVVGYVYKTSDSTLTAGAAVYSVGKQAFAALEPVSFDVEVLTANTEAFKLADQVVSRLGDFGVAASLPVNLASRAAQAGTSGVGLARAPSGPVDPDDVQAVTPTARKPALTPSERVVEGGHQLVDVGEPTKEIGTKAEVKRSGVPVWVWVVTGVAVAAGAGVGGYFTYTEVTKPVTGTVTASW